MAYVYPSDRKEVKSLDKNTFSKRARFTVFPHGMYDGVQVPVPDYAGSRPKDTSTDYLLGYERMDHPNHFSRFGYADCWNGYGVGHWPGKFRVSDDCTADEQPPDMAPADLYPKDDRFPENNSQTYIDSLEIRNAQMSGYPQSAPKSQCNAGPIPFNAIRKYKYCEN